MLTNKWQVEMEVIAIVTFFRSNLKIASGKFQPKHLSRSLTLQIFVFMRFLSIFLSTQKRLISRFDYISWNAMDCLINLRKSLDKFRGLCFFSLHEAKMCVLSIRSSKIGHYKTKCFEGKQMKQSDPNSFPPK